MVTGFWRTGGEAAPLDGNNTDFTRRASSVLTTRGTWLLMSRREELSTRRSVTCCSGIALLGAFDGTDLIKTDRAGRQLAQATNIPLVGLVGCTGTELPEA